MPRTSPLCIVPAMVASEPNKSRTPNEADLEPVVVPTRGITPSQIDGDALKVVRRLQRFGHRAYLVGGCVRDLLLNLKPKDFDVVTSARPHEVRKLFRNCRLIGRRFRLAHILFRGKVIETATFRAAVGEQADGELLIRSDNVYGTEMEDAYRRDFTINALFYDPVERVLIDYTGGLEDLVERRLRFIGQADIRVQEDPVRILRAIKFAARLGFQIAPDAWQAVVNFRQELAKAAAPRLLEEVIRMLRSGAAEASFRLLWESQTLDILLPEITCYLKRALERGEYKDPGAGLWAYLKAIDRSDRDLLTNAVLLSGLLIHPILDAADCGLGAYGHEGGSHAVGEVAKVMLRSLVERIRLSKWESERIGQLISGQKKLVRLKSNIPLPRALMRRVYFPEAIDLFELGIRVTGRGRRTLNRLRSAYKRPASAKSQKRPKKRSKRYNKRSKSRNRTKRKSTADK